MYSGQAGKLQRLGIIEKLVDRSNNPNLYRATAEAFTYWVNSGHDAEAARCPVCEEFVDLKDLRSSREMVGTCVRCGRQEMDVKTRTGLCGITNSC